LARSDSWLGHQGAKNTKCAISPEVMAVFIIGTSNKDKYPKPKTDMTPELIAGSSPNFYHRYKDT
jgi:hypothetical protein